MRVEEGAWRPNDRCELQKRPKRRRKTGKEHSEVLTRNSVRTLDNSNEVNPLKMADARKKRIKIH